MWLSRSSAISQVESSVSARVAMPSAGCRAVCEPVQRARQLQGGLLRPTQPYAQSASPLKNRELGGFWTGADSYDSRREFALDKREVHQFLDPGFFDRP